MHFKSEIPSCWLISSIWVSCFEQDGFSCPRSRLRIWSRETGSAVSSRVSACSFSILRLNLVLTRGIPPDVRGGLHLLSLPYPLGSGPSLSGHATMYRWRSLPRVRWHRVSSPQGSSSTGCCLCITIDQLLWASIFLQPLLLV